MAKGKPGVPRGTVNNPEGANQYASGKGEGQKNARLEIVLPVADKLLLKKVAANQGKSLSSWLLEVAIEAAQGEPIAS